MFKSVGFKIAIYSFLYLLLFFLVYYLYFQGIFSKFDIDRQGVILQNSIGFLIFFVGSIVLYFFLSKWISKTKKKDISLVIAKSIIFLFIACFQSVLSYSTFFIEMDYVENNAISSAISNELNIVLQSPSFSELSPEKKTELIDSIPSLKEEYTNETTLHDYYDRNGWIVSLTSIVSILVLTFSIFPTIDDYHEKQRVHYSP